MSNKVSFVTRKVFNENEEQIRIKEMYPARIDKAIKARKILAIKKRLEREKIEAILAGQQYMFDAPKQKYYSQRLEEWNKRWSPKLENAARSMLRSKQQLIDILKVNDFDFFVTLTFDKRKVNRLDDYDTRTMLFKWAKNIKWAFPDMLYVVVPEYHKKVVYTITCS